MKHAPNILGTTVETQQQCAQKHSALRQAFTLIELMVVMAIIGLLASMIMAFVSIGQRASDTNDTKVMMNMVGMALDQFVNETGAVPLPTGSKAAAEAMEAAASGSQAAEDADADLRISWYPEDNDGTWDKQQLAWRLGTKMSAKLRTMMYDQGKAASLVANPYQSKKYLQSHFSDYAAKVKEIFDNIKSQYGLRDSYFTDLYLKGRSNSDWGSGYISSGNWTANGFYRYQYLNLQGIIAEDLAKRRLLSIDSLEIDEHFIEGQTIIDSWGNPLVYIAYSTAVVPSARFQTGWQQFVAPQYGRQPMTDRNEDGAVNRADWGVEPAEVAAGAPNEDYNGDGLLNAEDLNAKYEHNGDGVIDEKDWGSLLYNAIPGRENSYFLGSAGIDGLSNVLATEAVNDDNVNLVEDYDG